MQLSLFKGDLVKLRAGYVLDEFDLEVVRTPLVLSHNDRLVWAFDIPDEDAGGVPVPITPKPSILPPEAEIITGGEEQEQQK